MGEQDWKAAGAAYDATGIGPHVMNNGRDFPHPDKLHDLSTHSSPAVRRFVSSAHHTSADTLHSLRRDPDPDVRLGVASHRNTRPETLQSMVDDPGLGHRVDAIVRSRLAGRSVTSEGVGEMTTSAGVGSGLAGTLGSQPKPPLDKMAYDFYATYGTTNPSNAMVAFGDYVRARGLTGSDVRKLRQKIQDDYGVSIIGYMHETDEATTPQARSPVASLGTRPKRPFREHSFLGRRKRHDGIERARLKGAVKALANTKPGKKLPDGSFEVELDDPAIKAGLSKEWQKGRTKKTEQGGNDDTKVQPAGKAIQVGPDAPQGSRHSYVVDSVSEELDPKCPKVIAAHKEIWCGPEKDKHRHYNEMKFEQEHIESCKRCKAYKPPPGVKHTHEGLTTADDGIGAGRISGGSPSSEYGNRNATRGGEEPMYRKSDKKKVEVTGGIRNQTKTGSVRVPGGPIDTNERKYFSVRQLGRGLFEIAFEGSRTRHSLRTAEESIRFRMLGYGGPYTRLAPMITEWLSREAQIGQEWVLDTQMGHAYILDDDGFLQHIRAELFV